VGTGDKNNIGRTQKASLAGVEDQIDVDKFFTRCDTNIMCAGGDNSEQ
jgi:hypothetical protein